jgi:hypothetical protein
MTVSRVSVMNSFPLLIVDGDAPFSGPENG